MGRRFGVTSTRSLLVATASVMGLALLTVLIFKQQLFDHWTFRWDFVGAYTATPAFVAASVSDGHLLSWSPFVASGFPVAVNPQAGLYFPGWWLLGGLGIPATLRVLTAVQVAHVLFGSLGVLALAKARRLAWPWALLAAVAYLLFGGFYGESEHSDIIRGFAYLPWLLWALTPPVEGDRWMRLATVPLLGWLIASAAYPGQLVSFGLCCLVYVGVALRTGDREVWRRYRLALGLAVVAAAGACVAVLFPYVRAEQAGELHRALVPTAAVRAGASIAPRDFLGLYLNNFAWIYDGTVTAWAIGIPALVGLACGRVEALRRHAPLIAAGGVALALAMAPKIGFVGQAMVKLRPLFPSRFPAADYKAVVAVAAIILAAEAWSQVVARRGGLRWRAVLVGLLLVVGVLLAPSTYGPPTRVRWLVIAVILASSALVLVRVPVPVLVCLLIGLVIVDGVREAYDYRLLGQTSSWRTLPVEAAPYRARDGYVRKLPALLNEAPATRPARVGPFAPLDKFPTGSDPDAAGWMGEGYHLIDYGGTIESVLWRVEHDPAWTALMLAPWQGYTFPCGTVGCSSHAVHLPPTATWRVSPGVRTVSYGTGEVVYSVDIKQPELMVENELAISGWRANTSKVQPVEADIPLRAWRLSAGRYKFTATYHEGAHSLQEVAVVLAALAWLGCGVALRRKRNPVAA